MKILTKRKIAIFLNLLIVIIAFLIAIWPKSATVRVYLPKYWRPFFGFTIIWLSSAIISGKYNFNLKKKFIDNWLIIFRSDLTGFSIILALLYLFNYFSYSRWIVIGTVGISFILETLFFTFWYYTKKFQKDKDISTYIIAPPKVYDESAEVFTKKLIELPETTAESVLQRLKTIYLEDEMTLFEFTQQNTQLDRIPADKAEVLYTHHIYNIKHKAPNSQLLFVNLHEVNGWNQINEYLRQVNRNLQTGGYFVSCGEDYRKRHLRYFQKYPGFLAMIATINDFIFRRIIQRIPFIREIYFALFQEMYKSFSQSEILGRIVYNGFDIVDILEKDNLFYFIAQKHTDIPPREDPIYGPLIKLKRVGKSGKTIYIYKLRTMFPYAEYLQEFVFLKNKLKKGGKIKDDFRILPYGNLLRRLWIDELPQIINLFRGDIKLVGVRAISKHYFSLYSSETQKLRKEVTPGLIPPFYVDMPHTFKEIMESESRYIKKYLKAPIITDINYFFKALYNIIFRHARSG